MKAWIIACAVALAACAPDAPPAPPPPEPPAPTQTGGVTISDAWIAASPGGASTGAGYVTIVNVGEADRLISVASPRALRVETHEMVMDGAIMKMRETDGVVIPAGESVALAPEGRHLMFLDIVSPFMAGETVPVQLTFERAGLVSVSFQVRQRGAPAGG
jgi:copper(I)-binding protein